MNTQTVHVLKAHVAINVKNLERSLAFYRKMLDIEPSRVREKYAKFDVKNPPLNLSLNEAPFGALSHMGIQVASTEDVLAVRDRWIQQGLIPRDEGKTECCYALQDKAWVRDPDGNEFVVIEDNLPEKKEAPVACCAPSCCAPAETVNG